MDFKAAESLTNQIAHHLADRIISGSLAPAERIQELKVAKDLGVSRGSVREALLILEGRRLIDILPRRGAIVTELTAAQAQDAFDLLELMLTFAARRARETITRGDEITLKAIIGDLQGAFDAGDADAFNAALCDYLGHVLPLGGNAYLDAAAHGLLPSVQRVYHRIFHARTGEMEPTLVFCRGLFDRLRGRVTAGCGESVDAEALIRAALARHARLAPQVVP